MDKILITDLFAYIDGTLTKETSDEITERIASDPLLQQQYIDLLAFEKNLNTEYVGVKMPRSLQASVLRQLRPKHTTTPHNHLVLSYYFFTMAFILTLTLIYWVWQSAPTTSSQFFPAISKILQKLPVFDIPILMIQSLYIVGLILSCLIIVDKAYMILAKKTKG